MVRAILNGTKTQTRRVVKDRHIDAAPPACFFQWLRERCTYGQPGDRLWVRETWQVVDGSERARRIVTDPSPSRGWIEYAATVHPGHEPPPRWRPSIHMPRWASRILLEITAARVERLQDISGEDAVAEGIARDGDGYERFHVDPDAPLGQSFTRNPVLAYRGLWEKINGVGTWDANPLVWVIEFKRVEGGDA
jgi:hypothetical protein